ncbi:MAG: hypothetical protein JKY56_00100 [Kofleriaceae bacterium]|nr:hypothetical protein [Kofleriaceae bacterium]
MKSYPSIGRKLKGKQRERKVHVFDKLDGSNLRFEWDPKKGWYRWGSRRRVIDATHPILGGAWKLFVEELASPLERIARNNRWQGMVAFAEFHGPNSLAGHHVETDQKKLSLFDVAPSRRGLLGPEEFLELFGELETPGYLGVFDWDDEFVAMVRRNALAGVTFEGVIAKAGSGHGLVMAKAKNQAWIDRVLKLYGEEAGQKMIDS